MSVKLPINQPISLSLIRTDPKAYNTPGKPPCVMYSVTLPDGSQDKLFLPPSAGKSIDDLLLNANEPFVICRRKGTSGEFYDVHTSAKEVTTRKPPASAPIDVVVPERRGMATAQYAVGHTRASSDMGAALIAAIDAATLAQQYAQSKGIALEFATEDLRCIANTLYIAATKDPLLGERLAAQAA